MCFQFSRRAASTGTNFMKPKKKTKKGFRSKSSSDKLLKFSQRETQSDCFKRLTFKNTIYTYVMTQANDSQEDGWCE